MKDNFHTTTLSFRVIFTFFRIYKSMRKIRRKREKIKTANEIAENLLEPILNDLKVSANQEVLLHVNGFGNTTLMELYLLFEASNKILNKKKIIISRSLVGNYTTSLDMAGASITITKLNDDIKEHWDSPVHTAALRWKI